ncbi:MAG: hypothetical protein HY313_10315 [Acidobacteria bacterium]|nr:hypothetical protein [Acidobacteriota bacterium]
MKAGLPLDPKKYRATSKCVQHTKERFMGKYVQRMLHILFQCQDSGTRPSISKIVLRHTKENPAGLALLSFAFGSGLLLPLDCYAYIDPNMGGYLFQLLFPLLVAIGGLWSIFRQRIGALWSHIFRRRDKRV